MARVTRVLFVTWRGLADASLYYPVGRLCEFVEDVGPGTAYEFVYVEGVKAAQSAGFQPFLEFPTLDRVYRSRALFPLFANRLMTSSRPDFEQYVRRLGLVPPNLHPMDILGRSMGARATDTIELFPLPVRPAATGKYTTHFLLRGIRHRTSEQQQRIDRLTAGEILSTKPEPTNPHDPSAMLVLTVDDVFVGYVPSYLAEDARRLYQECNELSVQVEQVNPAPAPIQHRILCRLEACWPDGFEPFATPRYAPLSERANPVNTAALADA